MSGALFPAVAALGGGALLAVVLFLPYVAVQYRRRGALGFRPTLLALANLLYALGLVAYTMLPVPTSRSAFCADSGAATNLVPFQFVADVLRLGAATPAGLLSNPAFQGAVFNLLLFVPLGVLVRHQTHRSVPVTALVGLGVSALVELTQLTGAWGLFGCSWRTFDVDDLLINTSGALLGALLAPLLRILPEQRAADPGATRPVGGLRRLTGMVCDYLLTGIGLVVAVPWAAWSSVSGAGVPDGVDRFLSTTLPSVVAVAFSLVWVLVAGRTAGEAVVRLRPVVPPSRGALLARWLLGIGGFQLLGAWGATQGAADLLLLASLVAVPLTRHRRGLAYRLLGWDVQDDRVPPVRV